MDAVNALREEFNAQIENVKQHIERRLRDVEALIRRDLIDLIAGRLEEVEPTPEEDQFVAEVMGRAAERSAARSKAMNTPPEFGNVKATGSPGVADTSDPGGDLGRSGGGGTAAHPTDPAPAG